MTFDPLVLALLLGISTLANAIVAAIVSPLFEKYNLDKFWLMYPSWILSGVFVWFTGLNLFAPFIPNALIGQILTAVVAGGGANMLHDLTDAPTLRVFDLGSLDDDEGNG